MCYSLAKIFVGNTKKQIQKFRGKCSSHSGRFEGTGQSNRRRAGHTILAAHWNRPDYDILPKNRPDWTKNPSAGRFAIYSRVYLTIKQQFILDLSFSRECICLGRTVHFPRHSFIQSGIIYIKPATCSTLVHPIWDLVIFRKNILKNFVEKNILHFFRARFRMGPIWDYIYKTGHSSTFCDFSDFSKKVLIFFARI